MSYYKTEKLYDEMSVKELEQQKLRHFNNPKYYLKLIKPPFYYIWMHLLDLKIKKRKLLDENSN
jgi:hypothetical protein